MTHKEIDNRGCPAPSRCLTLKSPGRTLQGEHEEFTLTVIVDNEAARDNVTRFAGTAGCRVTAENREDGTMLSFEI